MRGGEQDASLASYQQAWELTNSTNLAVKLINNLDQLDRQREALLFLRQWVEASPEDSRVHLAGAMVYQQRNLPTQAMALYEKVYLVAPDNVIALNNLAWLYQDDNPDRALELSRRAAELAPENADVLDTYGFILLQRGDRQQALEMLQKASSLAPDNASITEHLNAAQ